MYIAPNSSVHFFKNVPCDIDYKNTLYFANKAAQYNFFLSNSRLKYTLNNQSYQRFNRGIRVNLPVNSLVDCNYLAFSNQSYSDKLFFAFITNLEYVNDNTTYVEFEIDVIQTFIFDVNLRQCFIERNHTASDTIGDNIVPENLELGEYVYNNYDVVYNLRDLCVCVAIADTNGNLYDGVYGACSLWIYDRTDVQGLNALINNYIEKPEQIVAIYMLPLEFVGGTIPATHKLGYGTSANSFEKTLSALAGTESLNGYGPRNKKMYTYPFNFLNVDNASGSNLALRYEFFQNRTPVLQINGTVTQPVVANLRPCNYKGLASASGVNRSLNSENIQLNNYPICSWSVDTYKSWVAQNAVPIAINTATSVISSGIFSGNFAGYSAISQVGNLLSQNYINSNKADTTKGTFNNGGVNCSTGKQNFYYGRMSVNSQYAKMIDDYFTKYGYAIKQIGTPALNNRQRWTYIKTQDSNAVGGCDSSFIRKINNIFDSGITFWKNADEVGNYSLANNPN